MATEQRSIVRGAGPLVAGRVASMALTFVLPLALARLLDAAAFGTYKQLFLVAQTVLLAGQLGLTQSLYYFLPRGGADRGAFVAQALLGLVPLALCLGLGVDLLLPSLARHLGDGALAALAAPAGLLAAGMLLAAPLEGALTSEGRVGLAGCAYVLSDGSRAALLLAGARLGGLPGLAWAGACWAALRVLALGALLALRIIPVAAPHRQALARQLSYALPVALSAWLAVAQRQFVQYAVAARFDAAAFALFSVASFHLPVVDIVYTPVGEVLMVELGRSSAASAASRRRAWDEAVARLAEVLWPATACAFLFGPVVLPLLFGPRYAAAIPLFRITSLEIPLWVLPVDALLRASGRTRLLSAWCAARIPITAGCVLLGMRTAGLAGAICGGVISEVISRAVMFTAGRREFGPSTWQLVDPTLVRIAVASTGAALPAWLVERAAAGRSGLALAIGAYGLAYLALRKLLARRGEPVREVAEVPTRQAPSA